MVLLAMGKRGEQMDDVALACPTNHSLLAAVWVVMVLPLLYVTLKNTCFRNRTDMTAQGAGECRCHG